MSLMQLLTVGHSFMDVKNVPSPYRVNRRGLLPRFEGTPAVKAGGLISEAPEGVEEQAELQLFAEQNQTLMTPETGSMASAASEATVSASSNPLIGADPLERFSKEACEVDLMRPRLKLRAGKTETTPGAVVLRQDDRKVFKKLVLDRLYWPEWMFARTVVEPNKRRGTRGVRKQPVRVARHSLSLSDVEVVTATIVKPERVGWTKKPLQAWNWLAGYWRGRGLRRG